MILKIGVVSLAVAIEGDAGRPLKREIGEIFQGYGAAGGTAGATLTIRYRPGIPLHKLFSPADLDALGRYFHSVGERFPGTEVFFGRRKRPGAGVRGTYLKNGWPPVNPSIPALFHRDRMAALCYESFLLLIDFDTPSGDLYVLRDDFMHDRSAIRLAVQGAVGLLVPVYGGVMFHACSIGDSGAGRLFFGASGAGKSTIARRVGPERLLSDDGTLCFFRGGDLHIFPSPFTQVPHMIKNDGDIPATEFFFLVQDAGNFLERVSHGEAMSRILHNHIHFFRYFPGKEAKETFEAIGALVERHAFYDLHFTRALDYDAFFGEKKDDRKKAI